MRKLLNVLIVVALVAGGLYGLAKGAMYYRVKSSLDELADQARMHGELTYGGIETALAGRVAVRDLAFAPAGIDGRVSVAKVTVAGPDALFFIRPQALWSDDTTPMPPRLRLVAEGVEVPLGLAAEAASAEAGGAVEACTGQPMAEAGLLADIGLDAMAMDMEMGWDYDELGQRLDADFDFVVTGMQSVSGMLSLADVAPDTFSGGAATMPQLRGFETRMHFEPAFGERYIAACAERRGIETAAFRDELVRQQLLAAETAGVQLGAGLRFALERLYAEWGEIKLTARPAQPLGMLSLVFLPPERLVDTLGLTLTVNDMPISDLSVRMVGPDQGGGLAGLFGQGQSGQSAQPVTRKRYVKDWIDVQPGGLRGYVDRDVRLHSADQPPREGRLVAIDNNIAQVQQLIHGGKFTAYMPLGEVTRAEVEIRREVSPSVSGAGAPAPAE